MDIATIFATCRARGISLSAPLDGTIRAVFPKGMDFEDLKPELIAHKPELLAILRSGKEWLPHIDRQLTPADPWWWVLDCAWHRDGQEPEGAFGVLLYMVNCGCEIGRSVGGSLRLHAGDLGSREYEGAYNELRERYLTPRAATVRSILEEARRAMAEARPASGGQSAVT